MNIARRILVAVFVTIVGSVAFVLFFGDSEPDESTGVGLLGSSKSAIESSVDGITPPQPLIVTSDEPVTTSVSSVVEVPAESRRSLADDAKRRFAIPEVATLVGYLLREDGAALSGAKIAVVDPETSVERVCETDDSGRFVARPLHVGRAYTASVRHAGGVADGFTIEPLHVGVNERTIRVESRVLLRGRVVELDTGRPVAGVRITVGGVAEQRIVSGGDGSFLVHRTRVLEATTSDDADAVLVQSWPKVGFGTRTRIPTASLTHDREWLVFVGRGGRISGSIRSPQGHPITGIGEIALRPVSADETLPALGDGATRDLAITREPNGRVDDSGHFTLFDVPPRLRREIAFRLPSGSEVTWPAPYVSLDGTDVTVEIVVPDRPGILVVETLDRTGPIEATLSWSGADVTGRKVTDNQGRLRVEGLPVGPLRVRATLQARGEPRIRQAFGSQDAPKFRGPSIERDVEILTDGETHLRLEVGEPRSLRGRVVDREGSPVAGVRVVVKRIDLSHLFARPREGDASIPQTPPFQSFAITDSRGQFAFAELPPDPRWLVGLDDPRYRYDGEDVAAGSEAIELRPIPAHESRGSPPPK